MLTIVSIVICASVISTILLYLNHRLQEISLWIIRPHKPETKENNILDITTKDVQKLKSVIFVFPIFIILYSILIWIGSLFLNLFNIG